MGRFDYGTGLVPKMPESFWRQMAELEMQTNSLRAVGASEADIKRHHVALVACARMQEEPNVWTMIEGMRAGVAMVAEGKPLIPSDPADWVYEVRRHIYGYTGHRAILERTLGFQQWLAAVRLAWSE